MLRWTESLRRCSNIDNVNYIFRIRASVISWEIWERNMGSRQGVPETGNLQSE